MKRVYNFSAGPAALPLPVLEKAQKELVCYEDKGMSVMEMSHRSKMYLEIFDETEKVLRELMSIPDNYKVLFLQGGAWTQFSMVPLNLFKNKKADFVNTGMWATKAIEEASKFGTANVIASSKDKNFTYIPKLDPKTFDKDADYFHICSNNTVYGTKYNVLPDVGNVPLVSDMSSYILSEEIDVSKFGVIYAGAQKNIGPAGLTIVIIREDLITDPISPIPTMLQYTTQAKSGSMFNTPPTYGIYMAKLVFEWLRDLGGVSEIQKINETKAKLIYDYLDESKMFNGTVVPEDRSKMNITFVSGDADLDALFAKESNDAGFVNLKGHRAVGGMRASIYNAVTLEAVQDLVKFMKEFEMKNR